MIRATEYNSQSGRIGGTLFAADDAVLQSMRDMTHFDAELDGHWPGEEYYISNGQPTERPASPVTLSELTLQGVPAGSTLTINGESYENVEGDIELEFPLPGTYRLRVECWPYRDWEGEVTSP